MFVYPIPGTIALRNALLLLGALLLLARHRATFPGGVGWLRPAAIAWCMMAVWIVAQALVFADSAVGALGQWRSNWLNPVLTGLIAAWAAARLGGPAPLRTATLALAAHAAWLLGWHLYIWLDGGIWPFKATPFASYDYHSTLIGFLFALIVADRIVWLRQRLSPLDVGGSRGWLLLLLSLAADVALQARNGTLVDLAVVAAGALAIIGGQGLRRRHAVVGLLAVLLLGAATFQFDSRWRGLREAAQIGWTSQSIYWLKDVPENLPATPSGAALEESAYFRVAWARRAIDFVAERPMGNGFGHEAFGRAVASHYGVAGYGSSHSSLLDYAVGIGLPGAALLVVLAMAILIPAWRAFARDGDGPALLIAFLSGSYFLRCILDGHLSGWRFGLFAFLLGLLVAAAATVRKQPG